LHHRVSPILTKISDDSTSTEAREERERAQDPSGWLVTPWTFRIKFPYGTQFIFGLLMFVIGKDKNLELLTRGPGPRHPAPVYGVSPYYPVNPFTSGGACSDLNPHAGPYYLSAMTSQGRPIGKTILHSLPKASSSSGLGATPDWDSIEDYPETRCNACWNPAIEACHISMVGPAKGNSQNSSIKYPTIGGFVASNAQTPSSNVVGDLNPDVNVVRL
jgi:hypothetical protein